jgi:hypothetical protein
VSTIFRRKRSGHAWETGTDTGDPGSGDVIPVATDGGSETEYADTVIGSGEARTVVLPAGGSVLAVAIEGAAFPCLLIAFDPTDSGTPYIVFNDGTTDPWTDGAFLGKASPVGIGLPVGLSLSAGNIVLDSGTIYMNAGLPTVDPGSSGQVWVDPVSHVLKLSP